MSRPSWLLIGAAAGITACAGLQPAWFTSDVDLRRDYHSYAQPQAFVTEHVSLDLSVDFERQVLDGQAELRLRRIAEDADLLVLDTRDLDVAAVEAAAGEGPWAPAGFRLGARDEVLGSPLEIALPRHADRVRIRYATRPEASGLQWLAPAQTAGKQHPFLFTQSQAIHARSWIPLQDTPQVRITYDARVRTPRRLLAVMAAEMDANAPRDGDYRFRMRQPIPSYLIALAVGDLRFAALGPRSGVYTEPKLLEAARREFSDTEQMLRQCERLYGPYRWGRYDLLILPPSFPYGGMENPRLTFASPSIIAGDKSLVALVAHELAHSWSGNLVTNATWRDFWLNEGTTTYLTYRIMDAVYGQRRGDMERALAYRDLQEAIAQVERPGDRALAVDLRDRNPDHFVGSIPYVRGERFLTYLEAKFGRAAFDAFLRSWFDEHAFRSATTEDFIGWLEGRLLARNPGVIARKKVEAWIYGAEWPEDGVVPVSTAFAEVDVLRDEWLAETRPTRRLPAQRWSVHEWRHFLDALPALPHARLAELDRAFGLTASRNAFIARSWLRLAIRSEYAPADAALERYLLGTGRMRLINPLYRDLVKTPAGRARAEAIYAKARPGYHPIAQGVVDRILSDG